MALKQLPHNLGGVDFLSRPGVAQAIDADHANLHAVAATGVAHRRQRSGGISHNDFGIAAVVTGPAREGLRNTLQPLVAADWNIPPAGIGLQTRDDKSFARGHVFESAVSRLTGGCPATAVQIENHGQRRAPVIPGRNEQPLRPLAPAGHELTLLDSRSMGQIARRRRALRLHNGNNSEQNGYCCYKRWNAHRKPLSCVGEQTAHSASVTISNPSL